MIGIVSAGGYVPRYRLSGKTLAAVWGSGAAGGERAVAGYDEDSLTMAVEASLNALHGTTARSYTATDRVRWPARTRVCFRSGRRGES